MEPNAWCARCEQYHYQEQPDPAAPRREDGMVIAECLACCIQRLHDSRPKERS